MEARDAYLAAWREELEAVITNAVEACVDVQSEKPCGFLANHIAKQAGLKSFEDLEATVEELQAALSRSRKLLLSTRLSSDHSHAGSSDFVQQLTAETASDDTTLEYLLQNYADPENLPSPDNPWATVSNSRQAATTFKVLQAVARLSGSRRRSATHPCIHVVGREHLPSAQPTDVQLSRVLAVAQAIDKCEWDADLLTLCDILHHPMAFVVEVCGGSMPAPSLASRRPSKRGSAVTRRSGGGGLTLLPPRVAARAEKVQRGGRAGLRSAAAQGGKPLHSLHSLHRLRSAAAQGEKPEMYAHAATHSHGYAHARTYAICAERARTCTHAAHAHTHAAPPLRSYAR